MIVFLFFDGFLIIHVFIQNQLLIFRKKLDNQKSIKKQKYDQKNWKTIKNKINMMKIMTKTLQIHEIYKT